MKNHNLKLLKFNRYPEKSGELIPFYVKNFKELKFKIERFFFFIWKKKIY